MRTIDDIKNDILNYFKDNEDDFIQCITDLDCYNGYLGDDRWESMDFFDDFFHDYEPWEIARAAFYGDFRPCDNYWKFNAYGNLESTDYLDYSGYLDEYFVDAWLKRCDELDIPDGLEDLLDELENAIYEEC